MSSTYFTMDGSYGDAELLITLDTTNWDDEMWRRVAQMTDSERYDFAEECFSKTSKKG